MIPVEMRDRLKQNIDKVRALKLQTLTLEERGEIFEKDGSTCYYTFDDGTHCAVGACLENSQLEEILNKNLNDDSVESIVDFLDGVDGVGITYLAELQAMHDDCCDNPHDVLDGTFEKFRKELNSIIETGELTPESMNEL